MSFDAVIRVIGEDTTQYIGEVVAIALRGILWADLENFGLMFINSPPDTLWKGYCPLDINTVPSGDTVAIVYSLR